MLEPFVKTNQTYYNAEVYNEPFNMGDGGQDQPLVRQ